MSRFQAGMVFVKTFVLVFVVGFGLYKYLEYAYSPIGTSLANTILFAERSLASSAGKYEYKPNSSPRLVMTMELKYPKLPVYNGPSYFQFHAKEYVRIVGLDK